MELKDFISQTLIHISEGVSEAQNMLKESGTKINPFFKTSEKNTKHSIGNLQRLGNEQPVFPIEFDIAIGETAGDGTKASIGVLSAILGAGVQTELKSSQSNISRIKFIVPIVLPEQKTE